MAPPVADYEFLSDYGYTPERELGKGSYGVTICATHDASGAQVAIKLLRRGESIDVKVRRELMHQLYPPLTHVNIARLFTVFLTPKYLALVMELCSGGDLFDFLVNAENSLPRLRTVFSQVVWAAAFMHSKGISHRDIKLENALIAEKNSNLVKICDFGACKNISVDSAPRSVRGSMPYISPEIVLASSKRNDLTYKYEGEMADVWSLGVLLYVLFQKSYPFQDPNNPNNTRAVAQRIIQFNYLPFTPMVPAEVRDLCKRIFVPVAKRITIKELSEEMNRWWSLGLCEAYMPHEPSAVDPSLLRIPQPSMAMMEQILNEAQHEGMLRRRIAAQASTDFSVSQGTFDDVVSRLGDQKM
ncbi:Serine/threonine-protein kinase SAPK10 [Porphyridium purpureum]|uniref:Serine/threonine-protein kinase SAPK10 n=1 Tax=Porphyridium purpureum TaxID=35688 RepID=A0A5J4Z0F8_PORPP|nr:Serine/threonine-protein kinase SAPK10 [Porphyridium purpureum]|eukprot:POR9433..scf208_2